MPTNPYDLQDSGEKANMALLGVALEDLKGIQKIPGFARVTVLTFHLGDSFSYDYS